MTKGRRWLALDADMFGKPFIHDLHDRFGPAGVVVWVAFLCTCKQSRTPGRITFMNSAQAASEMGIAGWELVDTKGETWDLDDFFAFTGRKKQTRRMPYGRRSDVRRTPYGQRMDVVATHWERWQDDARTANEHERKRRWAEENTRRARVAQPSRTRRVTRREIDADLDLDLDIPPTPLEGGADALRAESQNPEDLRAAVNDLMANLPPPPKPKPKRPADG